VLSQDPDLTYQRNFGTYEENDECL